MNELARADNDGCCVKTTIAVAKHRLILKTKTAVFFNDMVFLSFHALAGPTLSKNARVFAEHRNYPDAGKGLYQGKNSSAALSIPKSESQKRESQKGPGVKYL